jgi:hypothetical protein
MSRKIIPAIAVRKKCNISRTAFQEFRVNEDAATEEE